MLVEFKGGQVGDYFDSASTNSTPGLADAGTVDKDRVYRYKFLSSEGKGSKIPDMYEKMRYLMGNQISKDTLKRKRRSSRKFNPEDICLKQNLASSSLSLSSF